MKYNLNIKDINQKFVDDIAFVYIAYPGSLGPDGRIEFLLKNSDVYSCNIAYEDLDNYIDYNSLKNKLSIYGLELSSLAGINGLETVYLGGCGNYLSFKTDYAIEFYRLVYGKHPSEVFKQWNKYARYILYLHRQAIRYHHVPN